VRCVLIYNPIAGRNRLLRSEQLRRVENSLTALGHCVEITATTAAGSASIQAREALRTGAEIVFACGGDGTVHEVIQGLVSDSGEPATLGIIPMGSANALARHLRLSFDPVAAALQQIGGSPRAIPIGKLAYGDRSRYFAVMAGAGPDGALVYDLFASQKSTLGRVAYYLRAARLFATRRFRPFEVHYASEQSGTPCSSRAVSAMAVRVDDLGGLFSNLTGRLGSVHDEHLQLFILGPPAWLSLPLWFLSGWMNFHYLNPFLKIVNVAGFSCRPCSRSAAHFQADGEWLGRLPIDVTLVPNAIRILIPTQSVPSAPMPHVRN
jgi:diacylglycerol kinase (ATP)